MSEDEEPGLFIPWSTFVFILDHLREAVEALAELVDDAEEEAEQQPARVLSIVKKPKDDSGTTPPPTGN